MMDENAEHESLHDWSDKGNWNLFQVANDKNWWYEIMHTWK